MLSQSIEPRTGTAEVLPDVVNLDAKPEIHGPFPGMMGAEFGTTNERRYEVVHTDGSCYEVIADHIDVNVDASIVMLLRGGDLVTLCPLHSLVHVGRLLEDK